MKGSVKRTLAERIARSRRHPRRIMARFGPQETAHKGLVENLSDRGLFLTSSQVFPPRTPLSIDLLVGCEPIRVEGVVQWARQIPAVFAHVLPSGMGVRIVAATAAYFRLVSEVEKKRGPSPQAPTKRVR